MFSPSPNRGDPVTLDCRATGEQTAVEWYRDGRPVDIDPSVRTFYVTLTLVQF